MKKGVVGLLIVLAIVVLISPGLVGRLAEKSMDENLDWAATENQELTVTSQGFDRGWFSSAGQHRVAVHDGDLRDTLLRLAAVQSDDAVPDLVIDTRLDHGLVPFSSMTRDKGSLMPGLGSAVSTLSLEFSDGVKYDLPGTIYSEIGLTGNLESNLILEPGSFPRGDGTATWGGVDVLVTTSPSSRIVGFNGVIESFSVASLEDGFDVGKIEFSGNQRPTPFGFSVGDVAVTVASVTVPSPQGVQTLGPMSITTKATLDGGSLSDHSKAQLDNLPLPELGPTSVILDISVTDVDGASLGELIRALEEVDATMSHDDMMAAIEPEMQSFLASGFVFNFDRIAVIAPQGAMEMELLLELKETDVDQFTYASWLLALDASLDLSIPSALVDIALATDPQFHAAIGMGFLKKNGDAYEMTAEFKKGLLTVNGAPMPVPIPGMQ